MNIKQTLYFTRKIAVLLLVSFTLLGCISAKHPTKMCGTHAQTLPRSTACALCAAGLYHRLLGKGNVTVNKPINLCRQRDILYVKLHNHSSLSSAYFADAVMTTLRENTFVGKVVTREPTVYINVTPEPIKQLHAGYQWYSMDDPLTIGQIRQLYPHNGLLILEVRLQEFARHEPIAITLNLIDPTDGATIAFWRETRKVWYRTEDMHTVSVLRKFNHWLATIEHKCPAKHTNTVGGAQANNITQVSTPIQPAISSVLGTNVLIEAGAH